MCQISNADNGTAREELEIESPSEPALLSEVSEELPTSPPTPDPRPSESIIESPTGQVEEKATLPSHKERYQQFLKKLEQLPSVEEKLSEIIAFMEASLATKHGTPYFKSFWEARTLAQQLFKENGAGYLRPELWSQYSELSKEARRLKELLEEQSAFAAEQIEIAIDAIESELSTLPELIEKLQDDSSFVASEALKNNSSLYSQIQCELSIFNAQASRILGLRKELIRTEMRVRQKNKLFHRLSEAGDKVFPRRKELVKQISQQFITDVETFVRTRFASNGTAELSYMLRDEIKALQSNAKRLTLNTHAFSHTRQLLSDCWEKMKLSEKERKKARAQQKGFCKDNAQQLQSTLNAIEEEVQANAINVAEALNQLEKFTAEMRQTSLQRDDIEKLRDNVSALRSKLHERKDAEEQERLHHLQEKDRLKRDQIDQVKGEIDLLAASIDDCQLEELELRYGQLQNKIAALKIPKWEKHALEQALKPLKEGSVDKREKALLLLSEDDRQSIEQLKDLLKHRSEQRREIKQQLELFRKKGGTSGLDFQQAIDQAMNFDAQLLEYRERLEKVQQAIQELEGKIASLEAKII